MPAFGLSKTAAEGGRPAGPAWLQPGAQPDPGDGRAVARAAPPNPYAAVVPLLFDAMALPLRTRDLVEAVPGWRPLASMDATAELLRNLGHTVVRETRSRDGLTAADLPCIAEIAPGRPVVLLARTGEGDFDLLEPFGRPEDAVPASEGALSICRILPEEAGGTLGRGQQSRSLPTLIDLNAGLIRESFVYSWLAGTVALGYPLLVMMLFNTAILGGATDVVLPVILIALTLMVMDAQLRSSRAKSLARLRAEMQRQCQDWVEEKLLSLPVDALRSAPLVQQVQKMRDLAVQFSAALSSSVGLVVDLGFSVVLCAVLMLFAPALALGPAVAVVLLSLLAAKDRTAESRHGAARQQAHGAWIEGITETVRQADRLRDEQAEPLWTERMIGRWRRYADFQTAAQNRAAKRANLGMLITLVAGLVTIWIGAHAVIEGTLSQGGLIACLMLVWKILSPVQAFAGNADKLAAAQDLSRRLDRFRSLKEDGDAWPGRRALGNTPPRLRFEQVVLRADQHGTAIARQITAEIAPKTVTLLDGRGTTIASKALEALLGTESPPSGRILIDAFNIRQVGQHALRTSIAYAPREIHLFPLSIADNLRLARPEASMGAIGRALEDAGLAPDAPWLAEHMVTPMTEEEITALPVAIGRRLCLARAWLRRARLVLLDDPTAGLDHSGIRALSDKLERLRADATVIVASQDERMRALADKVLVV
ncbi:MAG: ATP-binding cassette domain-containing protein [Pseudomonadota bacterium]